MEVIILAAGQGQRMQPLTDSKPKPLLPVLNETLLGRLIRQFHQNKISSFKVVVGYLHEQIRNEVRLLEKKLNGLKVELILNERFAEDININSVCLSLPRDKSSLIVEADLILGDRTVSELVKECEKPGSIWFTRGSFKSDQLGGILKSDASGSIQEIKIVPAFKPEFENYQKLLGIMKVDSQQAPVFYSLLNEYANRTLKQYYLIPWIENLKQLPARAIDLNAHFAVSFNTPEEYHNAIDKLRNYSA